MIFFLGFTRLAVALPALVIILITLYRIRPRGIESAWPSLAHYVLCAIASSLFLWSCAYLPPFDHSGDWHKHFAVINELAQYQWPPINEGARTFLRYYLGYYFVPGLFTKIFGNRLIELFVFVHTSVGLFLILAFLLRQLRPSRPVLFLILFLLFSGLDLVGWLFFERGPSLLAHKEWWAGPFAYEGHATLFLWAPQHALAGMIGVLLLPSDRQTSMSPQGLSLLGASVLFWSPFAALGLVPFALAATVRYAREAFVDLSNILCGLVLGVPLIAYLLSGVGNVPHGLNWNRDSSSISTLAFFMMLEFGLYLMALGMCGWRYLCHPVVIVVVLLLLPFYTIGTHNDFTTRTCIPALTLLAMATSASLSEARDWRCIPLAVLMFIGSVTSVLEIIGRGTEAHVPAREQSLRSGLLAQEPYVMQYNAPLPNWVLRTDH